jgi:HlyD family secretion protein
MRHAFLFVCLLLLTACGRDDDSAWLGYAVGDTAFVAAPQAGWVARLGVQRGDVVKEGQLLFALDDVSQASARDQAIATLAQTAGQLREAEASLELTHRELIRQSGLLRAAAGTKQAYDIAKSNYDQAVARITQINAQEAQARAALANARYQLSERDVVARTSGRVEDVFFRAGEYAPAMTPVVSILPPKNVFVRFFVPETQFAHVKVGQHVAISCDGCGAAVTATITFIARQEEFTPPVIFSNGSREKLVFKIEARAPGGLKLNPGQPVQVRPL